MYFLQKILYKLTYDIYIKIKQNMKAFLDNKTTTTTIPTSGFWHPQIRVSTHLIRPSDTIVAIFQHQPISNLPLYLIKISLSMYSTTAAVHHHLSDLIIVKTPLNPRHFSCSFVPNTAPLPVASHYLCPSIQTTTH